MRGGVTHGVRCCRYCFQRHCELLRPNHLESQRRARARRHAPSSSPCRPQIRRTSWPQRPSCRPSSGPWLCAARGRGEEKNVRTAWAGSGGGSGGRPGRSYETASLQKHTHPCDVQATCDVLRGGLFRVGGVNEWGGSRFLWQGSVKCEQTGRPRVMSMSKKTKARQPKRTPPQKPK